MAKVKITGHASGTGIITITAPNTSTDRTITLPDADVTLGTPEGTVVKSTGESGGTKFLREDGDGTCSWQAAGGGGGGAMEFISTQTTGSSVTSVTLTGIGSTYNYHKLVMSWTYGTSTSFGAILDFRDGSTDIGAISHLSRHYGSSTSSQTGQAYIGLNLETTGESFLSEMNIYGLGETNKPLYGTGASYIDSGANGTAQISFWKDAVAGETIDGIIMKALWGDIPSGAKFTLYGIKDS